MKSSCRLKVALFADVIKKGKTLIGIADERHYRIGKKLLDIIYHGFECQHDIVFPEDGKFGTFSNGSWSGLVGMVYQRDADMAVSEIAITEERQQVVDFSYPFSVTEVTFITQQLKCTYDITTVLDLFEWEVWCYLGLLHLTMPFVFYFLSFKRYSFSKIVLNTSAAFFGQQSLKPSQKISERILVIFWLISMMIMSFTYKANLLSTLIYPHLNGVRVIPELSAEVEKGEYECTSYPGSFYGDQMLKSDIRTWQIIGQSLLKNNGNSDIVKALENVGNKKTAFIGSKINFIYLKNKYFISEDFFFIELPAIAMRKDFPYKSKVNKAIHRMYAGGLFEKILEEERFHSVLQNLIDLKPQNNDAVKALSLEHIFSAFCFLLIGYILSISCFIIELKSSCNRMQKK